MITICAFRTYSRYNSIIFVELFSLYTTNLYDKRIFSNFFAISCPITALSIVIVYEGQEADCGEAAEMRRMKSSPSNAAL